MPVFVERKRFVPGKAAEFETVLSWSKKKLRAERPQGNISVSCCWQGLKNDIYFSYSVAYRLLRDRCKLMNDFSYIEGLLFESCRKNNPCCVGVNLVPFYLWGIASELLGVRMY